MKRWLLAFPALVGCTDPEDDSFGEGVAVGNPTKGVTARVVPSDEVRNLRGSFAVSALSLSDCDGGDDVLVASDFGVVPGGTKVALPAGEFCGLAIEFAAPLELSGNFDDGARFVLALDVGAVEVETVEPFDTRGPALLLVLGPTGWLTSGDLESDHPSDLVTIAPGDERHDALAGAVSEASALYEDRDGNRSPDRDDRVLGRPPGTGSAGRRPAE